MSFHLELQLKNMGFIGETRWIKLLNEKNPYVTEEHE